VGSGMVRRSKHRACHKLSKTSVAKLIHDSFCHFSTQTMSRNRHGVALRCFAYTFVYQTSLVG
jgi:hypothetical protein